jgi:MraZ protein
MLRGNALAKVDDKGRLKLPAVFRAEVEPKYGTEFFVTSLRGESVRIYPMEVWSRIEDRLAQASSLNPAVMRFKSAVNYYGQTAAMDNQGRLLIHPLLRDRAGTSGEVAVLGQHDYLEVWNRAAFEERLSAEPLTDEDLAVLAELGV